MNIVIVSILIFAVFLLVLELGLYAYNIISNPDRSKVRRRLQSIAIRDIQSNGDELDIIKKRVLSEIPFLNRILYKTPGLRPLERLIRQADSKRPVGFFVLLMLVFTLFGFVIPYLKFHSLALPVVVAIIAGSTPILYLRYKKKKRIEKFTQQLPDALDLISRAMKAGQAFTSGLALVAEEFDDPIGAEFHETVEEINFGMSVEVAMRSLSDRVDSPDLSIFAVSVILQRETGGNLSEIIEKIAYLIRERYKLYGKVKTLTAEGRLSGAVLVGLPFVVMGIFFIVNPDYLKELFTESGKTMLAIAGFMMFCGIMLIRKIVNIEV